MPLKLRPTAASIPEVLERWQGYANCPALSVYPVILILSPGFISLALIEGIKKGLDHGVGHPPITSMQFKST